MQQQSVTATVIVMQFTNTVRYVQLLGDLMDVRLVNGNELN